MYLKNTEFPSPFSTFPETELHTTACKVAVSSDGLEHVCPEMLTTAALADPPSLSSLPFLPCAEDIEGRLPYSVLVCAAALLTVIITLCVRSPELTHLISESLYPSSNTYPFPPPPAPATIILLPVSLSLMSSDSTDT